MDRSYEQEPRPVTSFVDVVQELSDNEGLFLSRNYVRRVGPAGKSDPYPVHYEELNDIYRDRYIPMGSLVSNEFVESAQQLSKEERYIKMNPVYPILTVMNEATGDSESKLIDIPRLIIDDFLPVYSVPAGLPGEGEYIIIDFAEIVKDLMQYMGYTAENAIIQGPNGSTMLSYVDFVSRTLIAKEHRVADNVEPYILDTRGVAALNLLQMNSAQTFMQSRYRTVDAEDGRVEVTLHIAAKPDIQSRILSLIDMVEQQGRRLYYSKEGISGDEAISVLSVVDENRIQEPYCLVENVSLDMVVIDAYDAVLKLFPESQY